MPKDTAKHVTLQTTVKPDLAVWIQKQATAAGLSVAAFIRVELTRARTAMKLGSR